MGNSAMECNVNFDYYYKKNTLNSRNLHMNSHSMFQSESINCIDREITFFKIFGGNLELIVVVMADIVNIINIEMKILLKRRNQNLLTTK